LTKEMFFIIAVRNFSFDIVKAVVMCLLSIVYWIFNFNSMFHQLIKYEINLIAKCDLRKTS